MLQARSDEQRMKMEFEASENDKDRQARIIETQIRAAGYGSMVDINKNEQSDYRDAMEQIRKQDEYRERMGLEREKEGNRMNLAREDYSIKQQEIAARERVADKELEIARVNKNKYDVEQKNKKKK